MAEEEDASTLKLGEEFQDASCLFTSEVYISLQKKKEEKLRKANQAAEMGNMTPGGSIAVVNPEKELTAVFQNTLEYCKQFMRIPQEHTVREIRTYGSPFLLTQCYLSFIGFDLVST